MKKELGIWKSWILILSLVISTNAFALKKAEKLLASTLKHYKQGDYYTAHKELDKLVKFKKYRGLAYYWMGLIEVKLEDYEKAINHYKKAIKYKAPVKELFYEYGQANFSIDELKTARKAFSISRRKGYKPIMSLYYMGYISQLQEQYPKAIKIYKKIDRMDADKTKLVKQPSAFQLGEVYLKQAEKHPNPVKMVTKYVLPQFEHSLDIDDESSLSGDIEKKIYETKKKYGLIVTKMTNGRAVPRKLWSGNFSSEARYDANAITEADEAATKADNKDSWIYVNTLFARKQFLVYNIGMINPELRLSKTVYGDRNDSAMYSKDTQTIAPAVRSIWEHKAFGKMAQFGGAFEYSYGTKDLNSNKKQLFNSRSLGYSLNEKFRFFKAGDTLFTLKRNYTYSYNSASNSVADSLSVNQTIKLPGGKTLILISTLTSTANTNEMNDSDTLNVTMTYLWPKLWFFNIPTFVYSYTLTDTIRNFESRGYEHNHSPSLSLSKMFRRGTIKLTWKNAYTRVISKNKASNQYKAWNTGLSATFNF